MKKNLMVFSFLIILLVVGYFLFRKESIPVNSEPLPTPTMVQENVEQEIQKLLVEKYNKSTDGVEVTITKQDEGFASGGVKFGNDGSGEGGVWLAKKTGNLWKIVFDGNGSVDCDSLRQEHGFPDTILKPNFCD